MRLPNAERAEIPVAKLADYLLSTEHRFGRGKAAFFLARGFDRRRPEKLGAALRAHALQNEVTGTQQTAFGTRYRVEGPMAAPDSTSPGVRSVWFMRAGESRPRFVTAYPLKVRRPRP